MSSQREHEEPEVNALLEEVAIEQTVDQLDLTPEKIQVWKEFVGVDKNDGERLQALAPTLRPFDDDHIEKFRTQLEQYDDAADAISESPTDIAEFADRQGSYLQSVVSSEYDKAHFTDQAGIGAFCEEFEIPLRYYIGQLSVHFEILSEASTERTESNVTQILEEAGVEESTIHEVNEEIETNNQTLLSGMKLFTLDSQTVVESYLNSHERTYERELERRQEIAEESREGVTELKSLAGEVTTGSNEIADLTETEAENVSQIQDEMSNLSATIEEIAATADRVESVSGRASEAASEGQQSAETAVETLETIEEEGEAIRESITELQTQAEQISEVADVINGIADQTNLLALNASIEAARAGEAGDGFKVVADEVKNLAEESQTQAKEIEAMIAKIQSVIDETTTNAETTLGTIDAGIENVEKAMNQLDEITAVVDDAAHGTKEVAEATDEQARSAEKVATKIDETADRVTAIDDEIQDIAKSSEQQSAKVFQISSDLKQLSESFTK